MRRTILTASLSLLVASSSNAGDGPRVVTSHTCGIEFAVPQGWTMLSVPNADAGGCEFFLRARGWEPDPDCPERFGGSSVAGGLYLRIVEGPIGGDHGLRRDRRCPSGWAAEGEGSSCLSPAEGRASALVADVTTRLYCNGSYAGLNDGLAGYALGDNRLAVFQGACDIDVFAQIVASVRFDGAEKQGDTAAEACEEDVQ